MSAEQKKKSRKKSNITIKIKKEKVILKDKVEEIKELLTKRTRIKKNFDFLYHQIPHKTKKVKYITRIPPADPSLTQPVIQPIQPIQPPVQPIVIQPIFNNTTKLN